MSINFKGNITYDIKEELKNLLSTEHENTDYFVTVEVKEEMVPVIINENGTISKYQIDIAIFFNVTDKLDTLIIENKC